MKISLPSGETVIEAIFGNILQFMIGAGLLGIGALIEHYYRPAFWWFLGAAGLAALFITAAFWLALVAIVIEDTPNHDGDYPLT